MTDTSTSGHGPSLWTPRARALTLLPLSFVAERLQGLLRDVLPDADGAGD
ncbi:hypothetical protein AB0I94_15875 [Streptomyces sp. NPDC050147]